MAQLDFELRLRARQPQRVEWQLVDVNRSAEISSGGVQLSISLGCLCAQCGSQPAQGAETLAGALRPALQAIEAALDKDPGCSIRLGLELDHKLAILPWEMIPGPNGRPIVRAPRLRTYRVGNAAAAMPPGRSGPLRCLVAWANPQGRTFGALPSVRKEAEVVAEALRNRDGSTIDLDVLPRATEESLELAIEEHRPHLLHFVGHGVARPSGAGIVLHSGVKGRETVLPSAHLAGMLANVGTQVVALSCCHSGAYEHGPVRSLLDLGVPAVLAMQFAWRDDAAVAFCRAFYAALAVGEDLTEAAYQARAILGTTDLDWAGPVLYVHAGTDGMFRRCEEPVTTPAPKHNIPAEASRFVGRLKERRELRHRIVDKRQRLITILGVGGLGKTRLANQVALDVGFRFRDGVWLVECDGLVSREDLVAAIAGVVHSGQSGDMSEAGLIEAVRGRRLLIVLDCFENAVAHAPLLETLLQEVPGLYCLVTSRVVLRLPRGYDYALDTMTVVRRQGTESDSVSLFLDAVAHVAPQFKVSQRSKAKMAALCRQLEGVPLSIQLAAGRLRDMTLDELAAQIQASPLDVLKGRAVPGVRHSDLAAVIDGSFALLPNDSRKLLRLLSLFAGRFGVQEAAAVCGTAEVDMAEGMSRLRDHSLLHAIEVTGVMRFKLLDTVREYVSRIPRDAEALAQEARCRARHAEVYGSKARTIKGLMDEGKWVAANVALWEDLGNLREAVSFARRNNLVSLTAGFAMDLARTYFEAGLWTDFEGLAHAAERVSEATDNVSLRLEMLGLRGALARRRQQEDPARELWEERARIAREAQQHVVYADALIDLGLQAHDLGRRRAAREYVLRALRLARSQCDLPLIATARSMQAEFALANSDHEVARRRAKEAERSMLSAARDDSLLFVGHTVAKVYRELGDLNDSARTIGWVIRLAHERGRTLGLGWALLEYAKLCNAMGLAEREALALVTAEKIHAELESRLKEHSARALRDFRSGHHSKEVTEVLTSTVRTPWHDTVRTLIRDLD